jgi:hypothetical protein
MTGVETTRPSQADSAPAVLSQVISQRARILDRITGPIQFLGLVVMVCEFSLALTNKFVQRQDIQWFLSISMVSLFFMTVLGSFYLIICHHEKLYPPPLYPDEVVRDVFVRRNLPRKNLPTKHDMQTFIADLFVSIARPYPVPDLIPFVSVHFGIDQSAVRRTLIDMRDAGMLVIDDHAGVQLARLPSVKDDSVETPGRTQ